MAACRGRRSCSLQRSRPGPLGLIEATRSEASRQSRLAWCFALAAPARLAGATSEYSSRPADIRHDLDSCPLGHVDVAVRNEDGPSVAGQAVRPRAVVEVADSKHGAQPRTHRKRNSGEL